MTAFTTSPFFTPAPGIASLTVATIMSPIPAYRRPEPPRTRMHRISLAPVLSATRSRDSCWITTSLLTFPASCAGWFRCAPRTGVLLGLLEDLDETPTLGRRQRPGLHEE